MDDERWRYRFSGGVTATRTMWACPRWQRKCGYRNVLLCWKAHGDDTRLWPTQTRSGMTNISLPDHNFTQPNLPRNASCFHMRLEPILSWQFWAKETRILDVAPLNCFYSTRSASSSCWNYHKRIFHAWISSTSNDFPFFAFHSPGWPITRDTTRPSVCTMPLNACPQWPFSEGFVINSIFQAWNVVEGAISHAFHAHDTY